MTAAGPSTRLAALLALLWAPSGAFASQEPSRSLDRPILETTGIGNTEGHVRLAWKPADPDSGAANFQLVESDRADFADEMLRYEGPELGSFVSGLPAGEHHYRLRQRIGAGPWSPWSEPIIVSIEPHSLALAWSLFATGAGLVLAILCFLVVADRRQRAAVP